MNHDETNPNPEMKSWIEPELEARVIAWVAGEASPFEAAELERLCAEKPELAIFKRRIEAVHGLVGEAVRPEKEPLRMSAERREKLLATLGAGKSAEEKPVVLPLLSARKNRWAKQWWLVGTAACAMMATFVAVEMAPTFSKVRRDPAYNAAAVKEEKQRAEALARRSVAESSEVRSKKEEARMREDEARRVAIAGRANAARPPETIGFDGEARRVPVSPEEVKRRREARASMDAMGIPKNEVVALNYNGPARAQEPVQLSPFTAAGEASAGYAAASTLAGTRTNTSLQDIGSSVQVVTNQFLKDTGAADNFALRQYNTGTETGGLRANYENAGNKLAAQGGALVLGAASAASFADNVSPPPPMDLASEEKPVALSAFEVTASTDTGYSAAVTVTGAGRLPAPVAEPTDDELDAKKKADEAAQANDAPAMAPPPVEETSAAQEPVSTFSLHVSDVSFQLAKAALERGEAPEAARIRPEEFYNAFDYGDPAPAAAEKIGARIEQSAHPFLQQRNLVRIALKVPATGRGAGQPLRLTVLLDTSGSMEREDRAATVRAAMTSLLSLLGPDDTISVIGFARQPRLIADGVAGDATGELIEAIARTPAEGGTNLEEGLNAAIETGREHFEPAAQNRIVLITDGAANLGNADPARLAAKIEASRQDGIAFDACGVGLSGLDDDVLEALTRKGNGRYYVLDSAGDADAGFARQLAGAFRPAAENVKVQVRFNPARVGRYRLIGFEQHRLREEDFRNDAVDAAELAAEEGAVALYQVEVLPQGEGELGEIFVRFRDPASGEMIERSRTMAHDPGAPAFERASSSLQLAGTAALLAEKLRGSELADQFKLGELAGVVNALRGHYAESERVQELVRMFEQMRRRSGE